MVKQPSLEQLPQPEVVEALVQRIDEAEMDEMWGFVGKEKTGMLVMVCDRSCQRKSAGSCVG
ncbi:hypothetical protein NDI45_08140 [Leptolyngbya sp. GB1-A1]|uniref:hypothetical protein n=1 Tax=Leptolyngbya sp. GB1-A1 TaxID=2933908 RepID=UPI0032981857